MSLWTLVGAAHYVNLGGAANADCNATDFGSGTSGSIAGVAVGDVIVVFCVNGGAQTVSDVRVNTNPSADTFNAGGRISQSGGNLDSYYCVVPNGSAQTGTITYGIDWSASTTSRAVIAQVWRPNGTLTVDTNSAGYQSAANTTVFASAASWVTTQADELLVCGGVSLNGKTWSLETINNSTSGVTIVNAGNVLHSWSNTAVSPGTMVQAYNEATLSASDNVMGFGFAFGTASSGGGGIILMGQACL